MPLLIRAAALLLWVSVCVASLPLHATAASPGASTGAPAGVEADLEVRLQTQPAATPDGPGKEILTRKCFQCHQASMWTSLRQDRKAWESTLYRMVGRGALWTEDEVTAMADYLGRMAGPAPAAPRTTGQK